MTRRRRSTLGGLVGLGCLVVVAGIIALTHRSGASPSDPATPVHLDSGTVFTPSARPSDAGYLTPEAAWARWEGGRGLPGDVTPQFGLLVDRGRHHLVWAFTRPGCSDPLDSTPAADRTAALTSVTCREWVFLSPTTGRHLLTTGLDETSR